MTSPLLVAVTQRVVDMPARNERRDVLDQAWAPFLHACGLELLAVPNRLADPVGYVRRLGAGAVILSGGNNISSSIGTIDGTPARLPGSDSDLAPERDFTETELLRGSIENGWPVIGVCRGMQVLNVFHGGGLRPVANHAGNRHALSSVDARRRFDDEVNSFHEFGVPPEATAAGLRVLASADGWPEAIEHSRYAHLGIMWHPERNRPSSNNDIALFSEFLSRRNPPSQSV